MLAERLVTLEMRELNERQRADLAVTRYRQTREALSHLEERNTELEERVSELSRKLLESQAKEGELSDRLAGEAVSGKYSPLLPFRLPPYSSVQLPLMSPFLPPPIPHSLFLYPPTLYLSLLGTRLKM